MITDDLELHDEELDPEDEVRAEISGRAFMESIRREQLRRIGE